MVILRSDRFSTCAVAGFVLSVPVPTLLIIPSFFLPRSTADEYGAALGAFVLVVMAWGFIASVVGLINTYEDKTLRGKALAVLGVSVPLLCVLALVLVSFAEELPAL